MTDNQDQATILAVDDSPMNIQILHEILHPTHRVLFATNGADALEVAAESLPDLILLDIMMPEMDGYEVCRRLKEDPRTRRIPVIFVTALSENEDEAKGLDLGAIDYLTKPVNRAVVLARVMNHLELKRYQDFLQNMAMLDGLTGIANRRNFDQALEREWKRAQRHAQPLSLLMLDVDFFKPYNDNYGHAQGDECLRQLAQAMSAATTRPTDLTARYGGEEFVCLLPETDRKGALALGEKIRAAVADLNLPHAYSKAAEHITISVGAASLTPSADTTPEQLQKTADQALYRAKEQGRNRVEAA
ncbi:PleD family two-component system response regulator [Desulfurivibrio dismutans]|uniref:PleD family two-component system response regulator n=1 Tax=Desulfurivibrio dismutans TaxID=1398908 RepID=UPI0023DC9122|nr:PleD family two-component system response regulator [Desulfurivibrio alkaliphilus]MDF1613680.1 PleD family two-component system response regulator [Desulfurivibrio alkaliphilus]